MVRPPTDSQWEAVRAWDAHVLVEAGAGTGKTFTVVNRILYLLGVEIRGDRIAEPVQLADIVAITFTRQAAADLKRDLRSALRESGRRADAHVVDQARIGTIHSFCADLVRDNTLRAGRAPLTGVLEEGEALARAEACVRDELLSALETHNVEGLDVLLGSWDTGKAEQWVLRLMRADALPRLPAAEHSPEELALIELARRAWHRMDARMAAEGVIDYDRMIAWTRDILRDDAGVRRMLQRRTHTLILDEFQDTDPLQREIAYLLAEPESGRTDTPRLMLVGDPKQSIYRFRGADVTVWSGVRRDFEEGGYGRRLRLTDNFRSGPSILSFVEATAGKWLNEPVAGGDLADYEVRFEPVDAFNADTASPAVELIVVPPDDNGKAPKAEERRHLEAAAVARRLLELNRAGTPWRDMALLLRSWGSSGIYAAAMRSAGVPVYTLRDDNFLETREVLDLIVALQAIRDPADDLAVFGFLRSPFVNLRDDTLLAIAASTRRPYARKLADSLPDTVPERDRVAAGIALLHDFAALRDRIPAAALLEELLLRTGYIAHLAMQGDDGAQAALNVRRFLQMIGKMEDVSVGMALRAIAEQRERKDDIPQARLHGEQDDVVLITSVHMAKGLDWPVVIFADLAAGAPGGGEKLLVGRDRIRLGERDAKTAEQPQRWQELNARLALEEEAEEKRVAYVALTRPKHRLILAGLAQNDTRAARLGRFLLGRFAALHTARDGDMLPFTGVDGVQRTMVARLATAPVAAVAPAEPIALAADAAAEPYHAVPTPLGLTRHSATELLAFSRCERRHALKYVYGIREPALEARGGGGGDAIVRGQIIHDVLERHEEDAELATLLEDAIGRWVEDAPPPDTPTGIAYRTELGGEIQRVLGMPEYAEAVNAPGARRELRFLHVLAGGVAMQGALDLAAPLGDALTIIDVKTSRTDNAGARRKAAEYAPQRDVYAASVSALSPLPLREFAFAFSHPGVTIAETIDASSCADARVRVEAALDLMGRVPMTPAVSSRECFFCGYRRSGLCPGVRGAGEGVESAENAVGDVAQGPTST